MKFRTCCYARLLAYLLFILSSFWSVVTVAQEEWQNLDQDWLETVLPQAQTFSGKQGSLPVMSGYQLRDGEQTLVGYVFTTPDIPPQEIGYSGPIDLLVGIDLEGRITGVKALHYMESHRLVRGDFITESGFLNQFINKNLADEFRPGDDIDGMSRATITSWAVARSIRNAARQVAVVNLPGLSYAVEANEQADALRSLQSQSWQQMIESGYVQELSVPTSDTSTLELAFAYMGHFRLGELLIGATDYSNADRTASGMVADGHMMLIGLGGNTSRLQQLRLGSSQDGVLYPNQDNRVVFAGTATQGKIAGQAQHAVALFLDPAIDITRPFNLVYDISPASGTFEDILEVQYQLPPTVLALVQGRPVNHNDSRTAVLTDWIQIAPLLAVLVIVALALRILPVFRLYLARRKEQDSD